MHTSVAIWLKPFWLKPCSNSSVCELVHVFAVAAMTASMPCSPIIPPIVPSRTQLRRMQRKHTLSCLYQGIQQLNVAIKSAAIFEEMRENDTSHALLQSIAIHKADNWALNSNIHFAGTANVLSKQSALKSEKKFKQHRTIHQLANHIKHNSDGSTARCLSTPCEQPMAASVNPPGILCNMCGVWNPIRIDHPSQENAVHSFVPFAGTPWNLNAPIYVPIEAEGHDERLHAPLALHPGDISPAIPDTDPSAAMAIEKNLITTAGACDPLQDTSDSGLPTSSDSLVQLSVDASQNYGPIVNYFDELFQPTLCQCVRMFSDRADKGDEERMTNEDVLQTLDEQERLEAEGAQLRVTGCRFCAGVSCVFCTSPVTLNEPQQGGRKSQEECTQQ